MGRDGAPGPSRRKRSRSDSEEAQSDEDSAREVMHDTNEEVNIGPGTVDGEIKFPNEKLTKARQNWNEATNAIAGMQVDENTAKHALSLVVRQLLWLSKEKKGEPILIRDVKTALKDMHQDKNNALAKHLMKQAQYVLLNGFGADLVEVQGPRGASAWMIISVFKEGQVDALIGAGFQGRQGGNPMAYDAQLRAFASILLPILHLNGGEMYHVELRKMLANFGIFLLDADVKPTKKKKKEDLRSVADEPDEALEMLKKWGIISFSDTPEGKLYKMGQTWTGAVGGEGALKLWYEGMIEQQGTVNQTLVADVDTSDVDIVED